MKWFRRLGIGALVLAALITALWWEENWRGQRMWEESCARLRAAGEPVELEDLVPPEIPDEENAAAAPIFAEVFAVSEERDGRRGKIPPDMSYEAKDGTRVREPSPRRPITREDMSYLAQWQAYLSGYHSGTAPAEPTQASPDEVLRSLSTWDEEWREVVVAMQRPKCRWPLDYEDTWNVKLKQLEPVRGLLHTARPRLMAVALKGDGEQYTEILLTSLRLARTFNHPPVHLLSYLVGRTYESSSLEDWLNTLACVELNEEQLTALQNQARLISVEAVRDSLRCERVRSSHLLRTMSPDDIAKFDNLFGSKDTFAEQAKSVMLGIRPRGWRLIEAVMYQDFHREHVESCISLTRGTIDPLSVAQIETKAAAFAEDASRLSLLQRVEGIFGYGSKMLEKAAATQARANAAVVWCAVERFRLKTGRVPESLRELTPDFIKELPCDPVNGEPLRYVRKGERDYLVYSIGWNLKDEGGVIGRSDGDWVWASHPKWMVNPELERQLAEEREREEEDKREGESGAKD